MNSEYLLICEYLDLTKSKEVESRYRKKYPVPIIKSYIVLILTDMSPVFPKKRDLNKRINFFLGLHEASSMYYEIFYDRR